MSVRPAGEVAPEEGAAPGEGAVPGAFGPLPPRSGAPGPGAPAGGGAGSGATPPRVPDGPAPEALAPEGPALGGPAPEGPGGQERLLAAVEAVLIVSDAPVTTRALSAALGLGAAEVERLLARLAAEYRGEVPGCRARGFVLRRAAGGWRLASAPAYYRVVEGFVIGGATARLSQAALETLAVIAYRQPVSRSRVSAIRGVAVDGVVRTLQARGLVEEAGTQPNGAVLYRTTEDFLELVGLDSLEDLPPLAPYLPGAGSLDELDAELDS